MLPNYYPKSALRFASNTGYSPSLENNFTLLPQTERTMQDLTSQQMAFGVVNMFDVRVFNPYAPSNKCSSLVSTYKKHEREKKRAYGQRVREVEHASFSPLVFSLTGGLGRETTCIIKRLASQLASKWHQPYSTTLNWLRTSFSSALLY